MVVAESHRGCPGVFLVFLIFTQLQKIFMELVWGVAFSLSICTLMDVTDLVFSEGLVLEETRFDFEHTDRLDLGLSTLKLFFAVFSIELNPVRQVFIFQKPQYLQVTGCDYNLSRLCFVFRVGMTF